MTTTTTTATTETTETPTTTKTPTRTVALPTAGITGCDGVRLRAWHWMTSQNIRWHSRSPQWKARRGAHTQHEDDDGSSACKKLPSPNTHTYTHKHTRTHLLQRYPTQSHTADNLAPKFCLAMRRRQTVIRNNAARLYHSCEQVRFSEWRRPKCKLLNTAGYSSYKRLLPKAF